MGKPFKKELEHIKDTMDWATSLNVNTLTDFFNKSSNLPLLCIGSGGSLSACYYTSLLYEHKYSISKALTPFDFLYSPNIAKRSKCLFISASGKNTDIQFALKKALEFDTPLLGNLSMKENNPLERTLQDYNNSYSLNYNIPIGKDGFLATNSLIAFFTIVYRSLNQQVKLSLDSDLTCFKNQEYINAYSDFSKQLMDRFNFTVLYGGWGMPVAYDIESKFTEAALGAVQLADYRNFGHGRHHWFDKQKRTSSIIAIITPKEKKIAEKTLALIPKEIPRIIVETNLDTSLSSIDLLVKSFYLVGFIGNIRGIDPGKPGVPEFGSKLYNLKYSSLYKDISKSINSQSKAICKKAHIDSLEELTSEEILTWKKSYTSFINKMNDADFTSIVFDYDGTLCSAKDRFETQLEEKVKDFFSSLLQNNIRIGIVTGRGGSIKEILRKSINKEYWSLIHIGYYNGADVGSLLEDDIPDKCSSPNESLILIKRILDDEYILNQTDLEKVDLRPSQLTIRTKNLKGFEKIKNICNQILLLNHINNVSILESSHSMDIIVRPKVSKLNLIDKVFNNDKVLCIGDKGLVPGNDFELLSTEYSLSVDEVSFHPRSCWNLASEGKKNIDAIHLYIDKIEIKNGFFKIRFDK